MSKTSKTKDAEGEPVLDELRESLVGWNLALEAHRMAPPDAGFSARLADLAEASSEQARAYGAAASDYEWAPNSPPADAPEAGRDAPREEVLSEGKPPYELRPGTGRRGPANLWRRFDEAVERLAEANDGPDLLAVSHAYEALAVAAAKLSEAIERGDRASSRRPQARRSA